MTTGLIRRDFLKTAASLGAGLFLGNEWLLGQTIPSNRDQAAPDLPFQYRTVSIENLARLEQDFMRVLESGAPSSNEVFRSYIAGYDFSLPEDFSDAKSIVIVSQDDWTVEIDFHLDGEVHKVVIPPGYVRNGPNMEELTAMVAAEVGGGEEVRLVPAALPYKLLAVRSGLAGYGKNNISFVPGYGSFHALIGFYCDKTFEDNSWSRVTTIPECRGCSICIDSCPTDAISEDQFVIDVGRCVTLYNERHEPMPDWMDPAHHSALVGCTKCQFPCPANADMVDRREHLAVVTDEETRHLVLGTLTEETTASIEAKFARTGLRGNLEHLGQNLSLALGSRRITVS